MVEKFKYYANPPAGQRLDNLELILSQIDVIAAMVVQQRESAILWKVHIHIWPKPWE